MKDAANLDFTEVSQLHRVVTEQGGTAAAGAAAGAVAAASSAASAISSAASATSSVACIESCTYGGREALPYNYVMNTCSRRSGRSSGRSGRSSRIIILIY